MNISELFKDVALLDIGQEEAFYKYAELLISYNEKVNLTAITDKDEINLKHFYDSCLPLKTGFLKEDMSGIDVGCGAGFPSIPLKIAMPSLEFTLMDSVGKKTAFLEKVISELELENVNVINMRAEDGARDENLREKFDFATARAVAPLNILMEYCVPFIKCGGLFIALKGKNAKEEMDGARNAAGTLGVKLIKTFEFILPGTDNIRNIIIYEKVKPTDKRYPRKAGKPSKSPL